MSGRAGRSSAMVSMRECSLSETVCLNGIGSWLENLAGGRAERSFCYGISWRGQSWDECRAVLYILTTAARQTGKTDKQTIVIQICQHEIDKDGTPDRDKSRQAKSRSQVTLQDTSREHTQMGRKHCIVYLFPSHERSKKENRKEREETAPA